MKPYIKPPTPNDIWDAFKRKWTGTDAELLGCIEMFYNDIRSTVELATVTLKPNDVVDTMDDYFGNHYGEA